MGLYDQKRVKELAEEQLREELGAYYEEISTITVEEEELKDLKLSNAEFERYYLLTQILAPSVLEKWHFYTSDMLLDEIENTDIYKEDTEGVYDLEMYLEHLLSENEIEGFLELGNDLWIANLGGN